MHQTLRTMNFAIILSCAGPSSEIGEASQYGEPPESARSRRTTSFPGEVLAPLRRGSLSAVRQTRSLP